MSPPGLPYGYELQFRLKFLEARGSEFQYFFTSLMERRDPNFRRVRPWGNQGDRKNDGWSPVTRTLFQVYAPASFSSSELAAKLTADLDGAVDYWEEHFDTWVFVHNDVDGLGPEVERKIAELNQRNDNVTCISWGREQIRREFAQLNETDLAALLGPPITMEHFFNIDVQSLQSLFEHLAASTSSVDHQRIRPVPVNKIERNRLGDSRAQMLIMGESKLPLVEEYLDRTSARPTYKSGVSVLFTDKYQELRAASDNPDEIFDKLLGWLTGGIAETERIVNAVAILAYFFFTCQIFEKVGS